MRRCAVPLLALALTLAVTGCGDPAESDDTYFEAADSGVSVLADGGSGLAGFDAQTPASADAGQTFDASSMPSSDANAQPPAPGGDAGPQPEAGLPRDASTASDAASSSTSDASGADAGSCPFAGHITYNLEQAAAPSAAQRAAYTKIDAAMKRAVTLYNCYTDITKMLRVQYVPSVATADGNANGTIRFGAESTFEHTRAMHEIAHTVGVGTSSRWSAMIRDGVFTGTSATEQLRILTGQPADVVHADSQHFWPYGLNYASEVKSDADLVGHCKMVVALRRDLGL
jgi:hypothetical protein